MRTYDPPPYTAPHVRIAANKRRERERETHDAALEAKYGPDFDKLSSDVRAALSRGVPEHPQATVTRRFNYIVYDRSWHTRWRNEERRRRANKNRNGWRTERRHFLAEVERFRRAEVEARKLRIVKKGRGKPLPKNHFASRRDAVERRDFAEKNW